MCGRYQRRSDKQRIAEAFAVGNVDGLALELAPDYNVAPQTMQPVIIWDEHEGTRTLQMMFWRFCHGTLPIQNSSSFPRLTLFTCAQNDASACDEHVGRTAGAGRAQEFCRATIAPAEMQIVVDIAGKPEADSEYGDDQ